MQTQKQIRDDISKLSKEHKEILFLASSSYLFTKTAKSNLDELFENIIGESCFLIDVTEEPEILEKLETKEKEIVERINSYFYPKFQQDKNLNKLTAFIINKILGYRKLNENTIADIYITTK